MNEKHLKAAQQYLVALTAHIKTEEAKRRLPATPQVVAVKPTKKRKPKAKVVYTDNINTKEQLELKNKIAELKAMYGR